MKNVKIAGILSENSVFLRLFLFFCLFFTLSVPKIRLINKLQIVQLKNLTTRYCICQGQSRGFINLLFLMDISCELAV